jgi:hypothetical protein
VTTNVARSRIACANSAHSTVLQFLRLDVVGRRDEGAGAATCGAGYSARAGGSVCCPNTTLPLKLTRRLDFGFTCLSVCPTVFFCGWTMKQRKMLLQTTMLSGVIGGVFLSGLGLRAADLETKQPFAVVPPTLPAVDGINAKIDGFGGSLANNALYGSQGALSIPLGGQFGAQIDGVVGRWAGHAFENVAPHLFWRNPTQGLIGIYTSHTWWDQFGGGYVGQLAGEAEAYMGPWTLQGIAGGEFGNSRTNIISTPTGTLFQSYNIKNRFFDQVNLKYYLNDNWDMYVGHRYLGGRNALALGTEIVLPFGLGRGAVASAFVEGRVGGNNAEGIWGGLKIYLGQRDKPLIARQRQDDPTLWSLGTLHTITSAFGQSFVPNPPTPPVSSCSSSCL